MNHSYRHYRWPSGTCMSARTEELVLSFRLPSQHLQFLKKASVRIPVYIVLPNPFPKGVTKLTLTSSFVWYVQLLQRGTSFTTTNRFPDLKQKPRLLQDFSTCLRKIPASMKVEVWSLCCINLLCLPCKT